MKTLVVYYSRTGTTKMVAELLAQQLEADVDEIRDTKDRRGLWGYILSGRDAATQRTTTIHPVKYNPAAYDMVVIATPVWASTVSTPIFTYLQQYKSALKAVSLVTTQGGAVADKVFTRFAAACGKTPLATLSISRNDFKRGNYQEKVKVLADSITAQH